MSGDGWETLSDEFWGDVPRLLHRWRAPSLSAPSFFLGLLLISLLVVSVQLRSIQSSRVGTRDESKLLLNTLRRLTISTTWLNLKP